VICDMSMPGFTADASLYPSASQYPMVTTSIALLDAVVPQQDYDGYLCSPDHELYGCFQWGGRGRGGAWHCLPLQASCEN
jgi:hypothetical protein